MAFSLSTEWKREMSRVPCERVWLVEIDARLISDGITSKTFKFVSSGVSLSLPDGAMASTRYIPCIASVKELGFEIHPVSREWKAEVMDIVFADDGTIRDVLKSYYLLGQAIRVKLGCTTLLNWSSFQQITGSIVAGMTVEEGRLVIHCSDIMAELLGKEITRSFLGRHPKHLIKQILFDSDVPGAFWSAADYTADNHWILGRTANSSVPGVLATAWRGINSSKIPTQPQSTGQMIRDICLITIGTFYQSQNGQYKFKLYDDTAAAAEILALNDIMDWAPERQWDNVITSVRIVLDEHPVADKTDWSLPVAGGGFAGGGRGWTAPGATRYSEKAVTVEIENRALSKTFGAANAEHRLQYTLATSWIVGNTEISTVERSTGLLDPRHLRVEDKEGTILNLLDCSYNCMSGTSTSSGSPGDYAAGWEPAAPQNVSAARPAYLLLTNSDGGTQEIIEIDLLQLTSSVSHLEEERRDGQVALGGDVSPYQPLFWKARIKTRDVDGMYVNGLGQSRPLMDYNTSNLLVTDVTVAFSTAKRLAKRFSKGAQLFKFRTDISHFGVEIGDFFELPAHLQAVDHGSSGLVSGNKYEVVRKELTIDGDSPALSWVVCKVVDETAATFTPAIRSEADRINTLLRARAIYDVVDNGELVKDQDPVSGMPDRYVVTW